MCSGMVAFKSPPECLVPLTVPNRLYWFLEDIAQHALLVMLSSYQLLDRCQMGGSGRCECAVYFEHLSQAHEIGQFVDIK